MFCKHIMRCYFRAAKRLGVHCRSPTTYDIPFCASHRRLSNVTFFYNLDVFMGTNEYITAENLYSCLSNLWSQLNTTTTTRRVTPSRLDYAFQGVEIMTYIMDHNHINAIGNTLHIPLRKQKVSAAFDIVYILWNVWHIGQNTNAMAALRVLQKKWRARGETRLARLRGPWPSVAATNDTDPFTLEAITDLRPGDMFSFWDGNAHVYAFSGPAFFDYVFLHDNIVNPLTRQALHHNIIDRLYRWNSMYRHTSIQQNQEVAPTEMQTPSILFTDVVSRLESKHNICLQPQWFLELNEVDIMCIFGQFHRFIRDTSSTNLAYMDNDVEIAAFTSGDPAPSQVALAKEMIFMIEHEDSPSYYICNLMIMLATFSNSIHLSLGEWVYDAAAATAAANS